MIYQAFLICFFIGLPQASPQAVEKSSGDSIPWVTSLPEALRQATAQKKLVVAYIYADWCPWCKRMDRETWPDAAVAAEARKHVFLKLNGEKDPDGIDLRERMRARGFPTILILNADGSEFDRISGFLQPEAFLERLRASLEDPESLGNLKASSARKPGDLALRYRLGRTYYNRMEMDEARKCFDEIIQQDPGNRNGTTDDALFYVAMCQAVQSNLEAAVATLNKLRREFPGSDQSPKATLLSGELMIQIGRPEEGRKRIEEFLKEYPDHPLVERAKRLLAEK
jgi:tetratricopeptide (TPR) repeat protein